MKWRGTRKRHKHENDVKLENGVKHENDVKLENCLKHENDVKLENCVKHENDVKLENYVDRENVFCFLVSSFLSFGLWDYFFHI